MDQDLSSITDRLRCNADDRATEAMVAAIENLVAKHVPEEADRCGHVLDILAAIADAFEDYWAQEVFEGMASLRLMRLLRRIEESPQCLAKEVGAAESTLASSALSCLWQASVRLGLLQVEGRGQHQVTKVQVDGEWRQKARFHRLRALPQAGCRAFLSRQSRN